MRDACSSWLADQSLHHKLVFKMADLVAVQGLALLHTCSEAHSAFRRLKVYNSYDVKPQTLYLTCMWFMVGKSTCLCIERKTKYCIFA